jgi:hypothetical protein
MKTWAKILGVAALVSGVLSFTRFSGDFGGGALKPLSAVLFGAAFICWVFAPEYASYDEEQKLKSIERDAPGQNESSQRSPNHMADEMTRV